MILKESQRFVNLVIEKLPPQQQLIYRLSREHGMSQEEIADKLQILKNTVKSHMNKVLQAIRHYLLQYSDGAICLYLIVKSILNKYRLSGTYSYLIVSEIIIFNSSIGEFILI